MMLPYLYNYLLGLAIVTALYTIYVQFGKGMGNVWIRKNSGTPMSENSY